ncbi:MAG: DUF1540 domain-containing protein [Christensenellales bacterium]
MAMKSLICQASDCMYNMHEKCSANVIQVNNTRQETYCDTYTKDDTFVATGREELRRGTFTDNIADTEFGAEFVDSPKIFCTAIKCSYNKSFHCKADGIEIDNPHDTMICDCKTYRPK